MAEQYRNAALSVGTTEVEVSRQITVGLRKVIVLTNVSTGTQRISLSINGNAVDSSSIVLFPYDSWIESIDSSFIPTQAQIRAIASAASGTLAIHERIEV